MPVADVVVVQRVADRRRAFADAPVLRRLNEMQYKTLVQNGNFADGSKKPSRSLIINIRNGRKISKKKNERKNIVLKNISILYLSLN